MNVKKMKFAIAGAVVVSSFVYLFLSSFQGKNLAYFMTVDEIAKEAATLGTRGLRVQGKIVPKSLKRNPDKMRIAFHLKGEKRTLAVSYRGVPPDLLENGFPVIAEGKLNGRGVLVAKNLMVACPSKFEDMKDTVKATNTNHEALVRKAKAQKEQMAARKAK